VFQTNDAGSSASTWLDISGGMPWIPVNCLKYQPNSPDRLYAGTDLGVYYRDKGTKVWIPYNDGLPNVVVSDIDILQSGQKLRISTYGRGMWEADMVKCPELTCTVDIKGPLTFCEGDSVVLTAQDGFASYVWSNGTIGKSITVNSTGNYSVTVYDQNGCPSGFGPIAVTVNQRRIPNIVSNKNIFTICNDTPIILDAGANFDTYKWSTGESTRTVTITNPGTYIISATNKLGCTDYDTVVVLSGTNPEKPTITMRNDTLFASPSYAYQWMLKDADIQGATTQFYVLPRFTNTRDYSVKAVSEQGCFTRSEIMTISSISEMSDDDHFMVYPNPASREVFIQVPHSIRDNELEAALIDLKGNTVFRTRIYKNDDLTFQLSLPELPGGTYWLQLQPKNRNPMSVSLIIQ